MGRRFDLEYRARWRRAFGFPTGPFSSASRKQRRGLPRRILEVLAAPKLLFRMATLVCLCDARDYGAIGLADDFGSRCDVVFLESRYRNSFDRNSSHQIAWRKVPALPTHNQCVLSLVPSSGIESCLRERCRILGTRRVSEGVQESDSRASCSLAYASGFHWRSSAVG